MSSVSNSVSTGLIVTPAATSSSSSSSSSSLPGRRIAWDANPVPLKGSPIAKIQNINVLVHKIVAYAPNFALLRVSKSFKKHTPGGMALLIQQKFRVPGSSLTEDQLDIEHISKQLPVYYQMMIDRRMPLTKYVDYTAKRLKEVIPLGILALRAEKSPILDIDWHNDLLEQRQKEFASLVPRIDLHNPQNSQDIAKGLMKYFLSINTGITPLQHPEANLLRSQDPTFVSRLLRYIFDRILLSIENGIDYLDALYKVANMFENDVNLTYEDLHYMLLAQVYMVLTRTFVDDNRQRVYINKIDSLLNNIKSKPIDLTLLKGHLDILVSRELYMQRRVTAAPGSQIELELNLARVKEVLAKHFPMPSKACIIL